MLCGRRLEDRLRKLCDAAMVQTGPELLDTIGELQGCLHELSLRLSNLTTASQMGMDSVMQERRRRAAPNRGGQTESFKVRPVPDDHSSIERQPRLAAVPGYEPVDGESVAATRVNGGERIEHRRFDCTNSGMVSVLGRRPHSVGV